MISRNKIFLRERLNLILENKFVIKLSKKGYTKLPTNGNIPSLNCPKDYKICPTIIYVSKNIKFVPLEILMKGIQYQNTGN
jgi:hypothetical protein